MVVSFLVAAHQLTLSRYFFKFTIMKKFILSIALLSTTLTFSGCETAQQILTDIGNTTSTGGTRGLSNADIVAGLKEALSVGTQNSVQKVSSVDGFLANAAIKILMPEEAKRVESTLRSVGMGSLVDKAITSMNRAAEDAAKGAGNIFLGAVRQMSITDAVNILKGGDFAATNYFKGKTTDALTNSFRPVIENALKSTNATKHWRDVFTAYNTFSKTPVNTDLTTYVTERAMEGIFYQVGLEEQKIRRDPVARTTDILKRVFGSSLAQGQSGY